MATPTLRARRYGVVRAAVAAAEVQRPGTRTTVTYIPSDIDDADSVHAAATVRPQ